MAIIRVKAGVVGFYVDGGRHMTKTAADAPFSCSDEQAAHLVEVGAAEYVGDAPRVAQIEVDSVSLADMTIKQLAEYAAKIGVDVSDCKKKADYIAAIEAADDDDMPNLSVADPE